MQQPDIESQTSRSSNGQRNGAPAGATPGAILANGAAIQTSGEKPGEASKQTPWHDTLQVLLGNPRLVVGLCIVGFFVLLALVGPFLARQGPTTLSHDLFQHPSLQHWLGTTQRGEDIFSQIAYGARYSLLISFGAATGSTLLSMLFGLTAGYFGGWIDEVLSFLINIFLTLPGLILAVVIASFAVRGPLSILLVLLVTGWAYGARVLRSQTLSIRSREFVAAATTMGEGSWRIIFTEILPNMIAIVAAGFVGTFIYAILTEVTLEFLGLGDITVPTWGTILYWAQGDAALLAGGWWQFVPAGLCVAILCAGLTFINFGVDEIANPALRQVGKQRKKRKVVV
ncbi:MAG TPA: ABC transporter permease [Ktedonosporobacter sp.]|nr:ABC transporter permease [Ktedonosporobacter sp.]